MAHPLDPATQVACGAAATVLNRRAPEFIDHLRASFTAIAGFQNPAAAAELVSRSILRAAIGQDPPDNAVIAAQHTGRELFLAGFDPTHSQRVCRGILDALRDLYPREWDSAASSSWIGLFFWVSARWAEGAAASQQAGERPLSAVTDQDPVSGPPFDRPPITPPIADEGPAAFDDDPDDDLDDDDEPTGYGGIMLSMTRGRREGRER